MRPSREFAELAAACALSALLFAVGVHVPIVGQAGVFFSSAPLIWAAARLGPGPGALGALLGVALLLPALPPPLTLIFAVEHAFVAPLLGWWIARGLPLSRGAAVGAAAATTLVTAAAHLLAGGGVDPAQLLEDQLRAGFAEVAGQGPGGAPVPFPDLDALLALVRRLLPSLTLVGVWLECALNALLVTRALARRGRARVPDLAAFSIPEPAVWVLIGALALAWAPQPASRTVALNALVPLLFAYLLQGLSIVLHLFARAGVGALGRALAAVALVASPWLLAAPLLLGVLDFRVGFRRRWPARPPPEVPGQTSGNGPGAAP